MSSEQEGGNPPYLFQRTTGQPSDTLENGRGNPAAYTGMIKTGFRPSDDAHILPFNVPVNAFASVALDGVAKILAAVDEPLMATRATSLSSQVKDGINSFGIINHPVAGRVGRGGVRAQCWLRVLLLVAWLTGVGRWSSVYTAWQCGFFLFGIVIRGPVA